MVTAVLGVTQTKDLLQDIFMESKSRAKLIISLQLGTYEGGLFH